MMCDAGLGPEAGPDRTMVPRETGPGLIRCQIDTAAFLVASTLLQQRVAQGNCH